MEQAKVDNQQKKRAICLDAFSESRRVTPKVWTKYEDCMVVVTQDDDLSLFWETLKEEMFFEEKDEEKIEAIVKGALSSEDLMESLKSEFANYKIALIVEMNEPTPFKVFGFEYLDED